MIVDVCEIKALSGVKPGDLYIGNSSNEESRLKREEIGFNYDKDTKNFHIFPMCDALLKSLDKEIKEKREGLEKKFRDLCGNLNYEAKETSEFHDLVKDSENRLDKNKLYYLKGIGRRGGNGKLRIYKHMTFYYRGALYYLRFIKFWHDEEEVHCCINAYQFCRINFDGGKDLQLRINKEGIAYPKGDAKSGKGANEETLVYNPDNEYTFYDPDGNCNIVNEFIKFIQEDAEKRLNGNRLAVL